MSLKKQIFFPPIRRRSLEPVRNTYKQDEIISEIARLGNRRQCPVCAITYGKPAMMRNVYQPLQRVDDQDNFRCIVCGCIRQI